MRKTSLSDITGNAAIGYQSDRRLSQLRYRKSGGVELSQFDYTYSASGNIRTWSQRRDTAAADLWTLGYDAADQLKTVQVSTGGTAAPGYAYGYDLGGNRTQEQALGTLTYAAHNELNQVTGLAPTSQTTSVRIAGTVNQASVVTANGQPATGGIAATSFAVNLPLAPGASTVTVVATTPAPNNKTTTQHYAVPVGSSATVASFVYDPVGNLVSQKGGTVGAEVTYAWDAANRLVKISKPGAVTEFVYDGLSRRVAEKYNGNIIKRWIWFNGDAQPAEERDAGNAVTRRFYSGMGEQSGGTNYFYTVDHLGSVRELTDATGAVRARYAYDPYGRRTKVSGDLEASFGYTGYYQHSASGLSLALYRAYDPRLGRFISRDPIEESGGINLYGYVNNNSVNLIDTLGLVPPIPMTSAQANLARAAFGPGGLGQGLQNPGLLDQASLRALGVYGYNAQRGLDLANSAATAATQQCRLNAVNGQYAQRGAALGVGAAAVGGVATASAIGGAPIGTATAILGVGTVGGLALASGGVGYTIGTGIANIPTGGGCNVSSSLGGAMYNAAPGFWNWAVK